jgi:hypothetical protein
MAGKQGVIQQDLARKSGNTEKETKMRELSEHKINPSNDILKITVIDEPDHGGANHAYDIEGGEAVPTHLRFQNGPINADGNGVNGITHEALLAVLCDRLRGFQAGPYACKANACALTHLEEAQHWLQQRTIERMRRGVEGTHTV